MRLPSEVGRRPAAVTSHPSRVASSISLPISVISRSLGFWPPFSSIRIIERNRIAISWVGCPDLGSRTASVRIDMGAFFLARVQWPSSPIQDLEAGYAPEVAGVAGHEWNGGAARVGRAPLIPFPNPLPPWFRISGGVGIV